MTTKTDIVDELFASDEASALTNRAAREIERLREKLGNAMEERAEIVGDLKILIQNHWIQ